MSKIKTTYYDKNQKVKKQVTENYVPKFNGRVITFGVKDKPKPGQTFVPVDLF